MYDEKLFSTRITLIARVLKMMLKILWERFLCSILLKILWGRFLCSIRLLQHIYTIILDYVSTISADFIASILVRARSWTGGGADDFTQLAPQLELQDSLHAAWKWLGRRSCELYL